MRIYDYAGMRGLEVSTSLPLMKMVTLRVLLFAISRGFGNSWHKWPPQDGTKKTAVMGFGCGFVSLMSATTISVSFAVMSTFCKQ